MLLAALVIFILSGPSCSVKKNNILSREFHKTLAHYNGYFNAREKVREGTKTLYDGQIDRYDRILSVFKYGTEAQAKAIFPQMDEAIKKVSIVIQRHSMEIDGKERNKWIEDCYLLIGTAQFLKHDTWTAIESFQYVAAQYRSEPIRFDALLGLAQCYLRLGKMPDADYLLSTMKDDKELPVDLKAYYNATYADYYLLQNDLENAAIHLEKAKSMTKKRAERYRYAFILGQIYQKLDKHSDAVARYDQVIKLSPPYEMSFNARVNRARSVDVNSKDGKEIRKMLEKMLTDEKNTEYKDQIYFALAEISLKENNVPQAIDLLKQSVASSISNTNQKALSFLKLAELNFKKPDYKLAQMYYDSTAATISEDHPDYLSIINTKNNLNKLIKNLNIIQTEDSLQALAGKTAGERELIIERMIEEQNQAKERARMEKKEREAAEKEAKEQMESNPSSNQPGNKPAPGAASGGGWYFSNPSAVSFGFNEFIRVWGNRKLEDNWRRSTRTSFAEVQELDESLALLDSTEFMDADTRDSLLAIDNAKRKSAYTSEIPVTAEQLAKSNEKIVEAYYNVGLIYKEQLKDNKESSKNFETLLQRYPENDYKIPTIYNLYRVNLAMGDEEKANYYKNIILTQYAETEYAKIILNPDYFKDQQRKVAIQKVFYENTYRAYLNKQYQDVIDRKELADSLFPASDLAPKFELLRAMAIGKSRTIPEFETALKGVVSHYPEDTVSVRAKEILAMINPSMYGREIAAPNPAAPGTPSNVVEAPKAKTVFKFSPDTLQYVVFIYTNNVISTNDFKIAVSNYNNKFFSVKKLQITSSFVGEEKQMVMIREFDNKQEGLTYLNGLLSDPEALSEIDLSSARYFTITPDNLLLLMQTKDVDGYDAFYEEKYLN